MSREKVCLTLFLSSAEGREEARRESKRPGRAQLPTSACGALAPPSPILGAQDKKRKEGVKERCRGLSPQTGLSSCAPGWTPSPPPPPHTPTEKKMGIYPPSSTTPTA